MATPPSMAKEPAASEATPLVTMLEVEVVVSLGVSEMGLVVMVDEGLAVVDRLPLMVDEMMVDEGTSKVVLVTDLVLAVLVEALLELVEVSESSSVAVAVGVAVASAELELPLSSGTIWKGKPYWKTLASDSRVIMMP
jgi:hypothetical protein